MVRYLRALCRSHPVTHQFLKAQSKYTHSVTNNLFGMTIAVNVTLTIASTKQTTLLTSLAPSPTQYCIANRIYQLITVKLRRLRSIVVIKCSSLFSYNTLIWTLILTSQNSTPEYLTGTGNLFSDVDHNIVCCDYMYDSTILGGSYYSVI